MRDDLYHTMARVEDEFWWFVAKRRIVRAMIERHGPRTTGGLKPRLTDIGCGTGGLLRDLQETHEVIGLDSHEAAREFCKRRGFDARHCWLPDDLPIDKATQDVCVMSDVLEHVEHDAPSVRAVAELLRPGGILVCTVPAHMWLWTARDDAHHHFRRYSRSGYEAIFRDAPLAPVRVSWYMSHLMPAMIAERAVAKTLRSKGSDDLRVPMKPVNAVFRGLFAAERHVLTRAGYPFGASLISVHRRV